MSMLEIVQSVGLVTGGAGTLIAAVAYAIRERSREARIRAETEHTEAHIDAAHTDTIIGTLRGMREDLDKANRRLDACEERHRASEKRERECERRTFEAMRMIDALRREMRARSITPPEMTTIALVEEIDE